MILLNEKELSWETLKLIGKDLDFGTPPQNNMVKEEQYIEKLLGELRIRKEDIPNLICLLEHMKNGGEEPVAWGNLDQDKEKGSLDLEALFARLGQGAQVSIFIEGDEGIGWGKCVLDEGLG